MTRVRRLTDEERLKIDRFTIGCYEPRNASTGGTWRRLLVRAAGWRTRRISAIVGSEFITRSRSQTAPVRLVQRAHIIKLSAGGTTPLEISRRVGVVDRVPYHWIKSFDEKRLVGLENAQRSGRPETYYQEQRSRVIAKARSVPPKPEGENIPATCHSALDLPQSERNKDSIPIKRCQIRRVLKAKHIRWQKSRTWLERDAP